MTKVYDSVVYFCAYVAHEANRAYCASLGDFSQPAYADAPENTKESAINGVVFILEDPRRTPEQSHENWLRFKEADGWSYGPDKDPDNKRHPCFMPYDQLPVEQRVKDHIFRNAVIGAAAAFMVL